MHLLGAYCAPGTMLTLKSHSNSACWLNTYCVPAMMPRAGAPVKLFPPAHQPRCLGPDASLTVGPHSPAVRQPTRSRSAG